jgi:hypothetical protein
MTKAMMTFLYRKSVILILIVSSLSKLCHPERSEGSCIRLCGCLRTEYEQSDEAISRMAVYPERNG